MKTSFLILSLFFLSFQALGQPLQRVAPEQTGMNSRQLTYADKAIETAINNKEIPGAVLGRRTPWQIGLSESLWK